MSRYGPGWKFGTLVAVGIAMAPLAVLSALYRDGPHIVDTDEVLTLWLIGVGIGYGMVVIHELGHALVALIARVPLIEFSVGTGIRIFSATIGQVAVVVRAAPGTGHVKWRVSEVPVSRARLTLLLIAGVVAEVLTGVVVACSVDFPTQITSFRDALAVYFVFGVAISAAMHAINCLTPFGDGNGDLSDGRQLSRLWRGTLDVVRPEFARGLTETQRLIDAGDYPTAIEQCRLLAFENSENPRLKVLLVSLYIQNGEHDTAVQVGAEALQELIRAPALRAELLDNLSCIPLYHDRTDLLGNADSWSEEAMRLAPDAITVKGTRGSVLVELGRFDEGIQLLEKVRRGSEENLDRAIAHAFLAKAFAAKGDTRASQEALQRAVDVFGSHPAIKRIAAQLGNNVT